MWYFTWIIGLTAALSLGIINVLWFDAREEQESGSPSDGQKTS